jgi:hypothetical protein
MSRTIRLGLGVLAWSGLTHGVLSLRLLPGDYAHSFCGRFGCLLPLQALAAMHGFWILVVGPPTAWAIRAGHPGALRTIGLSLTALAILGIGIVVGWESWTWTHRYGAAWRGYRPQRLLTTLVTTTDVPLLQILGAGIVLSIAGRPQPGDAAKGRVAHCLGSDYHTSQSRPLREAGSAPLPRSTP